MSTPVPAALDATPAKVLIVGGIGSGKSTALEAIRGQLRAAGQTVSTRITNDSDTDVALVIDDAHLLADSDLHRLTDLADDPDRTVVVATQSRDHAPALVALCAALERENPRMTLGPLPAGEIAALGETGEPARSAGYALHERLRRLDQRDLETLLIASLSSELGPADLAAALEVTDERAGELFDRARGTGLTHPALPLDFRRAVHQTVAQILGAARHHDVEIALLRTQLASATLPDQVALELAEHGIRDDGLAEWMASRADTGPRSAELDARIRWYQAAVATGAAVLRVGLADALALSGDRTGAAGLADALLSAPDPADRAAGVRIAASVATHDGNTAYAAELFSWLSATNDAATGSVAGSAAAIVHCAAGDLPAARLALESARGGPPTTAARAARSLAEGLLATVDGDYSAAAVKLGQSVAGEHGADVAMPDSAPALVTLAALHSGDSVRARSVIGRAVRAGGAPAVAARHRLLQGWVRMLDGQLAAAALDADSVGETTGREALWAAALRTAIARRGGDAGALSAHWFTAMDVLAEYSVDVFSLLPLGELWVAASRLRQQERLAATMDQAFALVGALGDPPAWTPLLHWAGVHAAILAGDPAAVAPHGQALAAMADHSPFAAALAGAGRTWLQVLANQVAPDAVITAARALARFGLTSDATRLAGQAALATSDPKVAALMLQVARDLKLGTGDTLPGLPADDTAAQTPSAPSRSAPTTLSEREREVAELLVLGMPYRDIGGQLFISAKTVEHHVARIRRRLGAQSRPEMLSMLRAMLANQP